MGVVLALWVSVLIQLVTNATGPRPACSLHQPLRLSLLNLTCPCLCIVDALKRETDGAPISLLAHSAGGWLARIYLLGFGTAGIDRLVSLGSPHNPPPQVSCLLPSLQGRAALAYLL